MKFIAHDSRVRALSRRVKASRTAARRALSGKFVELVEADAGAAPFGGTPARRLPVLLFDVMDTIVKDPFYHEIPLFLQMSLKTLYEVKHPTAWIEFERGEISEETLFARFFKDGREFDGQGLKRAMREAYRWIDGMEELLLRLQAAGYEMHVISNYPTWYQMIDEKLDLSKYLNWSFVSCHMGKRKPDPSIYTDAAEQLGVPLRDCLLIDDNAKNVQAAKDVGLRSIQFTSAEALEEQLHMLGLDFPERLNATI
eukprot:jgi/Mesvir1/23695/Mv18647-RA.1